MPFSTNRRPNIVLFLTDDHAPWSLPAYGNREVIAPNFDRLAREGVLFENAFTPTPVCSPARACLMTGRTASQVGIHDWLQEEDPAIGNRNWLAKEHTLPELLHDAGYFCGLSGKWHMGSTDRAPDGFDWHFGLTGWQGAHIEEYTYLFNGERKTLCGNKTQFITDHALQFLDQAPAEQPFFLNIGYIATHSPYGNQEPELKALYDNADFFDIPEYAPHRWHKNEGLAPGPHERAKLREQYGSYYAAVTDMDRNVGRVLDELQARGLMENSIVIYASDHGCALGHHGFWGKGNSTRPLNMYETSLRVPLIMRGPGLEAGKRIANCVDHYDTFQTLCEWGGVTLDQGRNYPGTSYGAIARGEELTGWRETRFGEYGDLRMIRTPEWKLVRRYPDGPDDLFDLRADPEEKTNLAADTQYASVRTALLDELEEWYAAHEEPTTSGLRVAELPQHNNGHEAWRDGLREKNLAERVS